MSILARLFEAIENDDPDILDQKFAGDVDEVSRRHKVSLQAGLQASEVIACRGDVIACLAIAIAFERSDPPPMTGAKEYILDSLAEIPERLRLESRLRDISLSFENHSLFLNPWRRVGIRFRDIAERNRILDRHMIPYPTLRDTWCGAFRTRDPELLDSGFARGILGKCREMGLAPSLTHKSFGRYNSQGGVNEFVAKAILEPPIERISEVNWKYPLWNLMTLLHREVPPAPYTFTYTLDALSAVAEGFERSAGKYSYLSGNCYPLWIQVGVRFRDLLLN